MVSVGTVEDAGPYGDDRFFNAPGIDYHCHCEERSDVAISWQRLVSAWDSPGDCLQTIDGTAYKLSENKPSGFSDPDVYFLACGGMC